MPSPPCPYPFSAPYLAGLSHPSRAPLKHQAPTPLQKVWCPLARGVPRKNGIGSVFGEGEEWRELVYMNEVYDAEGGSGSGGWDTLARKWNKGELLAGGPRYWHQDRPTWRSCAGGAFADWAISSMGKKGTTLLVCVNSYIYSTPPSPLLQTKS
jgi:hypothetical protein